MNREVESCNCISRTDYNHTMTTSIKCFGIDPIFLFTGLFCFSFFVVVFGSPKSEQIWGLGGCAWSDTVTEPGLVSVSSSTAAVTFEPLLHLGRGRSICQSPGALQHLTRPLGGADATVHLGWELRGSIPRHALD